MITEERVKELIADMESDWIERTTSIRDDKLGPAICAYSNDYPNRKQSGYILLGVNDDGTLAHKIWSDEQLQSIGNGEPDFDLSLTTKFRVSIPINQQWV